MLASLRPRRTTGARARVHQKSGTPMAMVMPIFVTGVIDSYSRVTARAASALGA